MPPLAACLRDDDVTGEKLDPKMAARLGGWDDIGLFMRTYAHAIQDATLTAKIFDMPLTQVDSETEEKQRVVEK